MDARQRARYTGSEDGVRLPRLFMLQNARIHRRVEGALTYPTVSPRRRRQEKLRKCIRYRQLYLLLLLPVFAVFFFHYVPIYGLQIAFRKYQPSKGIWGSQWVGLKYFIQFVNYPKFWQIMWNTLRISLYSLLTFPFPVIFAILLNDLRNGWFKRTAQMLTYAPHFISTVVLCSMTILFLNRETGVINSFVELLGGTRKDWMAQSSLFAPIYVITDLWQNLGWNSIIYLAALSSLSPDLLDASYVDGANRWHILWYIYLPHLMPTVIVMLLLKMGTLASIGFEKVFLLQNTLNLDSSTVLSTYVYNLGMLKGQYSYSAAVGLFENLLNLLLVVTFNAVSRKVSDTSLW